MTALDQPPVPKVKTSITLDADLVEEFSHGQLARNINAVLRAEKERRDQQRQLGELLERLAEERGPVDPDEVAEFDALLR